MFGNVLAHLGEISDDLVPAGILSLDFVEAWAHGYRGDLTIEILQATCGLVVEGFDLAEGPFHLLADDRFMGFEGQPLRLGQRLELLARRRLAVDQRRKEQAHRRLHDGKAAYARKGLHVLNQRLAFLLELLHQLLAVFIVVFALERLRQENFQALSSLSS